LHWQIQAQFLRLGVNLSQAVFHRDSHVMDQTFRVHQSSKLWSFPARPFRHKHPNQDPSLDCPQHWHVCHLHLVCHTRGTKRQAASLAGFVTETKIRFRKGCGTGRPRHESLQEGLAGLCSSNTALSSKWYPHQHHLPTSPTNTTHPACPVGPMLAHRGLHQEGCADVIKNVQPTRPTERCVCHASCWARGRFLLRL
jgi:hypothetical protein